MELKILRMRDLSRWLGVGPSTVWRWRRQGLLPPPVQLSRGVVGWRVQDIEAWIASRREGAQR